MLISCDIPLYKINNTEFKEFFKKYTSNKLPSDESTLRKYYLNDIYECSLNKIRCEIGERNIFVSTDETTDKMGRFICNVIVGTLERSPQSFLLTVEVIEKVNASNITIVFDNAMKLLWPEEVHRERVLLFVTDAARYMKKSARALQVLYPKMVHVTCVAHAVHRICENIRCQYPDIDNLISNVKKIFLKCPSRISQFKEMEPDIPLPPKPVLTRWGTWLAAASYYATYYTKIKNIIDNLKDEAESIMLAKHLFADDRLQVQLAYLHTNFSFLIEPNGGVFTKLEQRGQPIQEVLSVLSLIEMKLKEAQGQVAELVLQKFLKIISENEGLRQIKVVADIVSGSNVARLPEKMDIRDIDSLNWAPLTSCDVERSFSSYKAALRDNRLSFLPDNLKKHLVISCLNSFNKKIE